jgi:hypothetical protein
VAIDECWPVEKIRWIREHTLAITKGRRGGAEIDLQRQNVLLKWIDEQLPIIASECQRSVIGTQATNDCRSASISTNLGKRKRSSDQTCHVKNSRRRVQFTEPSNTKSLPVEPADARGARCYEPRTTSDVLAQYQDFVCRACCLRTEADTNDSCDDTDSRTCRTGRTCRQATNLLGI